MSRLNASMLVGLVMMFLGTGCQTARPMATVDYVDLKRFSGSWFVIANIPTFMETDAYNAKESYQLNEDGTIATTFAFNKGAFDGPQKTYTPKGYVIDTGSNAVWDMQFVWPFKAEYLIVFLNPEYSVTVIGRSKRDYVWIMARRPTVDPDEYLRIIRFLKEQGYDTDQIQKIPHQSIAAD